MPPLLHKHQGRHRHTVRKKTKYIGDKFIALVAREKDGGKRVTRLFLDMRERKGRKRGVGNDLGSGGRQEGKNGGSD